jgi:hypothetical protein
LMKLDAGACRHLMASITGCSMWRPNVQLRPCHPWPMCDSVPQLFILPHRLMPCSLGLVWLISHSWKYCWPIWCERKILFVDWKNMAYKSNKHKRTGCKLLVVSSQPMSPSVASLPCVSYS